MYDVIVIGLGSMGASTLYHLAKQDLKVLGIEQFEITHQLGSHSGQTRIVRKSYFEHADYVPLLERAYHGWDQIYQETGTKLFHRTGLTYFGKEYHPVIRGVKNSAELYSIPLESSSNEEETYPFTIPSNYKKIIEPDAGFVLSELTIKTYVSEAKKIGAENRINEKVEDWKLIGEEVLVSTNKGTYKAKKLIVTAGAYVQKLIPEFGNKLTVTRQFLAWIKPKNSEIFELGNFPCWMISDDKYEGVFYGFPILSQKVFGGNGLLKVAHHYVGDEIEPSDLNKMNTDTESEKMKTVLKKYLLDAYGNIESMSTCMYTNSKDDHFIIDFLPESNNQIILATGFSGHGFKFVPVIGEILCNMAIRGKKENSISFLGLERF